MILIPRALIASAGLMLCGCSTTIIYSPKTVSVEDSRHVTTEAAITGSDLREAKASQKSEGTLDGLGLP